MPVMDKSSNCHLAVFLQHSRPVYKDRQLHMYLASKLIYTLTIRTTISPKLLCTLFGAVLYAYM